MYQILNFLPFELYIIVLLIGLGCLVSGIFIMKKKQPGNPMIWMLPFGIMTDISLIAYRLTIELTLDNVFQETTKIVLILSVILFICSLFVTFNLAIKQNYIDSEPLKQIMPTLRGCGIALIIIAVLLFIVTTLRDKMII